MKLPDFLVVGAQKSGTTSLFLLLSKHPQLFLPLRKEVQFFSSPLFYPKGLDWYAKEFFNACPEGKLAGEISPQYMYSNEIARRIHYALPKIKIIAILRDPIDRAYSQFMMSKRRGQEKRPFAEAFDASAKIYENVPEFQNYYHFSNYESVLSEYLRLYGRDSILILFQEDLKSHPKEVIRQVCVFLDITEVIPENINVRVNQSGEVRFKFLARLIKSDSIARKALSAFVPRKLRRIIIFWIDIFNIRPNNGDGITEELRNTYNGFARRQAAFLQSEFGLNPPWPEVMKITTQNYPDCE
mgnify:CR=1 FL=1|jgi:hypothetical protein|tara:strand:+ start:3398 stop:4294 length:897 start_codon:yes stop_codon:yes gene_type:complete